MTREIFNKAFHIDHDITVLKNHCSTAGLEEYSEEEKDWVAWYDEDGLDFNEHFEE